MCDFDENKKSEYNYVPDDYLLPICTHFHEFLLHIYAHYLKTTKSI